MATYKQPCIHCKTFIDWDARFCPTCGSHSPFGYHCPDCLREIHKNEAVCAGCGRPLYITCPSCSGRTFVQEKCDGCGASLMVKCRNSRCGVLQFFENTKCTACGKKMKKRSPGTKPGVAAVELAISEESSATTFLYQGFEEWDIFCRRLISLYRRYAYIKFSGDKLICCLSLFTCSRFKIVLIKVYIIRTIRGILNSAVIYSWDFISVQTDTGLSPKPKGASPCFACGLRYLQRIV